MSIFNCASGSKLKYYRHLIMLKDTILSEDRRYRYVLSRTWDEARKVILTLPTNIHLTKVKGVFCKLPSRV